MANRLADSTSPYLLQHADNPVDWYEWGPEAFDEARTRDVPVLLSVGYASCHWCHVMAHESFEDPETAAVMNELFVNVKVDREERPDVDRVYMDAVQTMTGRGGWPMTVFMTPEGEPFFAGTYFPNEDRHGHPSFERVMRAVREAWDQRRDQVAGQAARLTAAIAAGMPPTEGELDEDLLRDIYRHTESTFDPVDGGFGGSPKFPQAPTLEFLLRIRGRSWAPNAEHMFLATLDAIAAGGIHDHVGGGFSRYSVDGRWLVPHFEKMLYDNALLLRAYAWAHRITGDPAYAAVTRSTAEYLLRDLALPDGGFASGEDADSEGVEGKFYVFGWEEFVEAVGPDDARLSAAVLGVTPEGNFEGASIVHRAAAPEVVADGLGVSVDEIQAAVGRALRRLREIRSDRVRPGLDDKVVTAWNALAVRGLVDAWWALGDDRWLDAAVRTMEFLEGSLRVDGRWMRSWRNGETRVRGFADDHGAAAVAAVSLYEATGHRRWLELAVDTFADLERLFAAPDGGWFATAEDAEKLVARPQNLYDNPTPSDNALGAEAALLLWGLTGDDAYRQSMDRALAASLALAQRAPTAVPYHAAVSATVASPFRQIAVVVPPGTDASAAVETIGSVADPNRVVAVGERDEIPLLEGREAMKGQVTVYVCEGFVCELPVTDSVQIEAAVRRQS